MAVITLVLPHPLLLAACMDWILLLAQATDTAAAAPPRGWLAVLGDFAFGITLLFIFLVAIVTILVQQRSRDKCLKLLHDYHVTYTTAAGQTMWGDLVVYSQGLELIFDQPYRNAKGIIKSSAMIYQGEMAQCLAICRVDEALTDRERRARRRQIRRTFQPGLFRRFRRWVRNVFNTLRDAFSKALTMIIGQISKARPTSVLTTQRAEVEQISQTILGTVGNAYEPILERHIGKPVVLTLASPADPDKTVVEIPGYLAEYSDKYLAIFNVEHKPIEQFELELTESCQKPGFKVDLEPRQVRITCLGHDVVVIHRLTTAGTTFDLSVPLTNGNSVRLARLDDGPVKLAVARTRRIDLVCPRAHASVHFGGQVQEMVTKSRGLAPSHDAEATAAAAYVDH